MNAAHRRPRRGRAAHEAHRRGATRARRNTVILVFDLAMVFAAAALYQAGKVDFAGVLIPSVALMSSFGPVVALA